MWRVVVVITIVVVWVSALASQRVDASDQQDHSILDWGELPSLPDAYGFAGTFAGVSGNALIVAGGSNFPTENRWRDDAKKAFYDHVFVLTDPDEKWVKLSSVPTLVE